MTDKKEGPPDNPFTDNITDIEPVGISVNPIMSMLGSVLGADIGNTLNDFMKEKKEFENDIIESLHTSNALLSRIAYALESIAQSQKEI